MIRGRLDLLASWQLAICTIIVYDVYLDSVSPLSTLIVQQYTRNSNSLDQKTFRLLDP